METMKILEKDIQLAMLDWLQYQPNTFVWRQNAGSMYAESATGRHGFKSASVAGISDIMGVWNGKPLAVEVKRPGGKATENQLKFLHNFAKAGGIAILAFDLSQLQEALEKQEKLTDKASTGVFARFTAKGRVVPQKNAQLARQSRTGPNITPKGGNC